MDLPEKMDYKELLRKYILLVGESEGVDFIPRQNPEDYKIYTGDILTSKELQELAEIANV